MSVDFQDARLARYEAFARCLSEPKDVLVRIFPEARFLVHYSLGGKEDIAPFPISRLADYFFDENGNVSTDGIPVHAPDLPDEYDELRVKYLDALATIQPSRRMDSVALSENEWQERIQQIFPKKGDDPHVCACMPSLYVAYDGKDPFWGIYYNTPILADPFFNILGENKPTVLFTAYALSHALSDDNGNLLLADVPLNVIILQGWRAYVTFWTNFWLTFHVIQDIYTARGNPDGFWELYSEDSLPVFRFAALVALVEKGSFGVQVVARPLLDVFKRFYDADATEYIRRNRAKIHLLERILRMAIFLTAYPYVSTPDVLPGVPKEINNAIRGSWSAFWLAHASGTGDPVAVKSGKKYRGVRGFVRVL